MSLTSAVSSQLPIKLDVVAPVSPISTQKTQHSSFVSNVLFHSSRFASRQDVTSSEPVRRSPNTSPMATKYTSFKVSSKWTHQNRNCIHKRATYRHLHETRPSPSPHCIGYVFMFYLRIGTKLHFYYWSYFTPPPFILRGITLQSHDFTQKTPQTFAPHLSQSRSHHTAFAPVQCCSLTPARSVWLTASS